MLTRVVAFCGFNKIQDFNSLSLLKVSNALRENQCFSNYIFIQSSNCELWSFKKNSLLTEPSAPTARPPAGGSLRSPTPPAARYARPQRGILKKIEEILPKKKIAEEKIWSRKFLKKKKLEKKIRENFFEIFFFRFSKIFFP